MRVLGVETSCDETGVAALRGRAPVFGPSGWRARSRSMRRYGGVVPELASRDHIAKLLPMVQDVLARGGARARRDLDAIAYTAGPGLIGALMVGGSFASSLAYGLKIPAIPVHHLEGHLLACMLEADGARVPVPRAARVGRSFAVHRGRGTSDATGSSAKRSTTRRARRSTRWHGCSACRTRAGRSSRRSRSAATRSGSRCLGP